jgi:hypothetical protein
MYIPINGVLYIDGVAPYVVRLEDAAMRVMPDLPLNTASGSFTLNAKLRSVP